MPQPKQHKKSIDSPFNTSSSNLTVALALSKKFSGRMRLSYSSLYWTAIYIVHFRSAHLISFANAVTDSDERARTAHPTVTEEDGSTNYGSSAGYCSSGSMTTVPGSVADDGSQGYNASTSIQAETDKDDDESDDDDENTDTDDNDVEVAYWELDVWGKPQYAEEEDREAVLGVVEATRKYMRQVFYIQSANSDGKFQCRNYHNDCSLWASEGACEDEEEYDYMVENCSPACHACDEYLKKWYEAADESDDDGEDDDRPETQEEPGLMSHTPWGVPQNMGSTVSVDTLQHALNETHRYMTETVLSNPQFYSDVLPDCENMHADCTYWAVMGECEENPVWMQTRCAPACHTCEQLDFDTRCPIDPNATEVFAKPGDLNTLFERIVTDPYWSEMYGPMEIISSPDTTGGPWLVMFDNFLTTDECFAFIEHGAQEGYERSEDSSHEENFDGTYGSEESEDRTSTNSWCYQNCHEDPIVKSVHERIENLTMTHYNFSEYYQLLRYEPGQFYGEHHDYVVTEWDRPQGPRILTVFMYLNDVVEGGGTHFMRINKTVMPKKGKMIIWPSVLDEDPLEWDVRTHHEALPVIKGMKYGANAWIHLRDFKTQDERACT